MLYVSCCFILFLPLAYFLNLSPPELYHPFGMFLFGRIVLRLPYPFVFQFIRQELLFDEIAFVAVGIFIFLSVP